MSGALLLAPAALRCTGKNEAPNGMDVVLTLQGNAPPGAAGELAMIRNAVVQVAVDRDVAARVPLGGSARIHIDLGGTS